MGSAVHSLNCGYTWADISSLRMEDCKWRSKSWTTNWANILVSFNNTSKAVFGLLPSTQYEWMVRSWCDTTGNRKSAYSASDFFTTSSFSKHAKPISGDISAPMLYPNPASTEVWVTTNAPVQKMELFSATGQLLQTYSPENQLRFKLDLTGIPQGLYLLKIEGQWNKFIIQR